MDYYRLVDRYRDEIVASTMDLIRIPSVKQASEPGAPFGRPLSLCLDAVLKKAERDGFEIENFDHYAGHVKWGTQNAIVGVVCHLDVVPAQKEGWKRPAFEPYIENGVIYGRGSNDNKGPSMAIYYALKALRDSGRKPKNRLHLIFGCDEEGTMSCMDYYKAQAVEMPTRGFVPDCTFPVNYGEHGLYTLRLVGQKPGYLKQITAGEHYHVMAGACEALVTNWPKDIEKLFDFFLRVEGLKGNLHFEKEEALITLIGKAAHGSRPYEGKCPSSAMLRFLGSLYSDQRLLSLGQILMDWKGRELNIAHKSMKYGELTDCLTMVRSNENEMSCYVDVRYPFDLKGGEIIEKIQQTMDNKNLDIHVDVVEDRPGSYKDPNNGDVRRLESIYRQVYGDAVTEMKVSPGDTYARKFEGLVAFGPTTRAHLNMAHIGQAHQVNEGMDIETLIKGAAIYMEALDYLLECE